MSCAGIYGPETQGLPDKTRDALTRELFARWEAAEPGAHHCFCGSDADLVAAVQRLRGESERERERG